MIYTDVFNRLKNLKDDWDGYGALPISERSLMNAKDIVAMIDIKPTDIYPNPNGTIQFEWDISDDNVISLEIGDNEFTCVRLINDDMHVIFGKAQISKQNFNKLNSYITKKNASHKNT